MFVSACVTTSVVVLYFVGGAGGVVVFRVFCITRLTNSYKNSRQVSLHVTFVVSTTIHSDNRARAFLIQRVELKKNPNKKKKPITKKKEQHKQTSPSKAQNSGRFLSNNKQNFRLSLICSVKFSLR